MTLLFQEADLFTSKNNKIDCFAHGVWSTMGLGYHMCGNFTWSFVLANCQDVQDVQDVDLLHP